MCLLTENISHSENVLEYTFVCVSYSVTLILFSFSIL